MSVKKKACMPQCAAFHHGERARAGSVCQPKSIGAAILSAQLSSFDAEGIKGFSVPQSWFTCQNVHWPSL